MALTVLLVVLEILGIFLSAPLLWLIGNSLAKTKVKFTKALLTDGVTVLLGIFLSVFYSYLSMDTLRMSLAIVWLVLTYLIMLVVRLCLISAFWQCGLWRALLISLLTGLAYAVIVGLLLFVLALVAFDFWLKLVSDIMGGI